MSAKPALHLLMLLFCFTSLLTAAQQSEETPQQSYDQEPQIEPHYSSAAGREVIICRVLRERNKTADEMFLEHVVDLTEGYSDELVKSVAHYMASKSEWAFVRSAATDQFIAEAIYAANPTCGENREETVAEILSVLYQYSIPEVYGALERYAPDGPLVMLKKDEQREQYVRRLFEAADLLLEPECIASFVGLLGDMAEWMIRAMIEHAARAPGMRVLDTNVCIDVMEVVIRDVEAPSAWRDFKLERLAQLRAAETQAGAGAAGESSRVLDMERLDFWQQIVRTILLDHQKIIRPEFLPAMTTLMVGYPEREVERILKRIVMASPKIIIDELACLDILLQAVEVFDTGTMRDKKSLSIYRLREAIMQDLAQETRAAVEVTSRSESMVCSEKIASDGISSEERNEAGFHGQRYPLLRDVYHLQEVKLYFKDAIEQLQQGHFRDDFRRGILLYGPPGVGKGEMVEAMINESGCTVYRIKASELVERYQGSGAQTIKETFAKAKVAKKGVIVFIDELQSLAPVTTDEAVQPLHDRAGQDFQNTLIQIWTEHDDCLRRHDHVLIIATCNEFELIDERVRERFRCIEFPHPDETGTRVILRNKADHFNVGLSEDELERYAKKMKGWSGRRLALFIQDTKTNIRSGMELDQALAQAFRAQSRAIDELKPSMWDTAQEYVLKGAKVAGSTIGVGTCSYIAWSLAGPLVTWRGLAPLLARLGLVRNDVRQSLSAHALGQNAGRAPVVAQREQELAA